MKQKTKEVTDVDEAMAKLGHRSIELPGGGNDVVTTTETEPDTPNPDTSGNDSQEPPQTPPDTSDDQTQLQFEEKVSSTQDEEGKLTEEEKKRRSWQSERDAALAEKQRLEQQIQQMQEQNRQLLNVVSPFMMKYGQQQNGDQANQAAVNKEPEPDFIEDGYFDPKKYADYQRKRDEWLGSQLENRITTNLQKRQEQQTTQQQLNEVVKEFPEYVNPLTGEVDTNRLQRDIQSYTANKTILDLVREAKGKGKPQPQSSNPLNDPSGLNAIEKNANRPQSVASSPDTEPNEKGKIKVPEKVSKQMQRLGVSAADLPPDFEGFSE